MFGLGLVRLVRYSRMIQELRGRGVIRIQEFSEEDRHRSTGGFRDLTGTRQLFIIMKYN